MKIHSIETIPVALPRRRAHSWRGNAAQIGTYLIVRLRTDDGLVGMGEAPALIDWGGDHGRYYGESQTTAAHVIAEYLEPAIKGEDPRRFEWIDALMDRVVAGHPYAKAAIGMACLDVVGKAAGLPVHAFLGGAFRSDIAIAHSFGIGMSADEVASEAELVLAEGVTNLKVKVGLDLERDIDAVRTIRRLRPDASLTVDANQAWPDVPTATDAIRRLDEYRLSAVEQPVEGIARMAEVRARVRPAIMADESAWTATDVCDIARVGAADQISIYYSKAGGLHRGRKVASTVEALGLRANVNGSAETGIGNAANLHLAACSRVIDLPCLIMVSAPRESLPTRYAGRLYEDDLITQPYVYRDGRIVVPDGPGLGVELDPQKLERYRTDR